ncbi:MAG: hypothetical protein ACK4NZ_00025 [Tsuneonella sp.]
MRHCDGVLATPRAWTLSIVAIAVLQAILIFTHRPWLDEVQALQLAVQAPDIPTLLEWLRYEGHPPLFYLLLRGLSYLVEPFFALPLLAAALALVTQFCILFASPFSRTERLLIATSEFMLFEFLTLSRSMTLGVMFIVLAMALWRRRSVWLAIALLPMCDFLFGVISMILVALKLRDRSIYWPGIAAWLVCGLLSAYLVRPADDMIPAIEHKSVIGDLLHVITGLGTLALPFQGGILPEWNKPPLPLAGILWVPFMILAHITTRSDRLHRIVLFTFIAISATFSLLVYPLSIRHLMLIALLLIALVWLRRSQGDRPIPSFRIWLAAASACGIATAAINFAMPFNTAPEAAAEIKRLGLADRHWQAWPDFRSQVVSALSGMEFERTELHCMHGPMRWNYRTALTTPRRFSNYLESEIERHGRFYLLSDIRISGLDPQIIRPLSHIPAGYDGQSYHLYVVGPTAAERPVDLPPCVSGQRPLERFTARI